MKISQKSKMWRKMVFQILSSWDLPNHNVFDYMLGALEIFHWIGVQHIGFLTCRTIVVKLLNIEQFLEW